MILLVFLTNIFFPLTQRCKIVNIENANLYNSYKCLNQLIKYFCEILRNNGILENRLAGPDTEYLLDAPKVLQKVQAARSAEVRLESLAKLGKELLADLPGYEEVAARLSSALREAEEKRRDLIESWVTFNCESLI